MKKEKSKLDHREVIYELKEDPLRKFKITFALMSIIPFLVFFYLILEKFFSFSILVGRTGFILALTIIISFLGFTLAYNIIFRLLGRLMLYAARVKKSDQLKSALVANVSHEVRNPLAIVKLTLSNLMDGVAGTINEVQSDIIKRCQETISRLTRMLNQLLDLSKIEAGKFLMRRSFIDMNFIIDNELSNFSSTLESKNIQLERQTPRFPVRIWGDRDKIVQMFINIFDNAIKYTPENGKVFVRLFPVDNNVQIEIEDTGRGIPADKLDKVFDKFERIAGGKEWGTGLGLPIAKDIVEMHRGRIWVESKERKGSKFVVLLPGDLRQRRR